MHKPSFLLIVAMVLLLSACAKRQQVHTPDPSPSYVIQAKYISQLRQIHDAAAFALYHEKGQADLLAVAEFHHVDGSGMSAAAVEYYLPGFKNSGKGGHVICVRGEVGLKWVSKPLPHPFGRFFAVTHDPIISCGPTSFPSVFYSPQFFAVFPVPEKVYYNHEPHGLIGGDLVVYELRRDWVKGVTDVLSAKESLDNPPVQPSPFGTVCCFLRTLRAAEANPEMMKLAREQLDELITRKADPQLIDTLFFLAINPSTGSSRAGDFLESLKSGIKDGRISKVSGARLGMAFLLLTELPYKEAGELIVMVRPGPINCRYELLPKEIQDVRWFIGLQGEIAAKRR